ncbi:MAG: NAD(P)/FAD-dependent oxidoreductase [Bdellovibrionaceae bacterium]|nr:NAD(P)/FAD-dependent oxidoreductase [Pseudobdellovibrionaceae bacterium]
MRGLIKKVVVIGGGPAGFFYAINLAQWANSKKLSVEITILEASNDFLKKLKISGGGRCNFTHNQFDIKEFIKHYPRGQKELRSVFHQFQAQDMVKWLEDRGVETKIESDGRMFPASDDSQTLVDLFIDSAKEFNIQLLSNQRVESVVNNNGQFKIQTKSQSFTAQTVMLATGSARQGYVIAEMLGHKVTDLAPSLFSFKIQHDLLADQSGVSFKNATLELRTENGFKLKGKGPLLITHWGLSGPAVLKISAWAARELKTSGYQAKLYVNWMGDNSLEEILKELNSFKQDYFKKSLVNQVPSTLTKNFWRSVLVSLQIAPDTKWGELKKKSVNRIAQTLYRCELTIRGKNRFKEEFVECGGVASKQVDFKTMQSKICPNLYFSGELLDIDGITGGFNLQNSWSTAYVAALNTAQITKP